MSAVEEISWLCAALRNSTVQEPSFSKVSIQQDTSAVIPKFNMCVLNLQSMSQRLAACWRPLFRRSVVAYEFPISARKDEIGLEIPLDVMLYLSGVDTAVNSDGKFILMGFSTALVPLSSFAEQSIQWHLITSSHENGISLRDVQSTGARSVKEFPERGFSREEFLDAFGKKRHFLGWCKNVKITLGTHPKYGGKYTNSTYTRASESRLTFTFTSVTATAGSSGLGYGGATLGGGWTVSKNRYSPFTDVNQRFESILSISKKLPSIMYDPFERRAWLVPTLSVILHMIHVRCIDCPSKIYLPYAIPSWDGGAAAYDAIISNRHIKIGPQDPKNPYVLQDIVTELWHSLKNLRSKAAARRIWELTTTLFGYEFMDVANSSTPFRLKKVQIQNSGGWTDLTHEVEIVLFCSGFGEVITPQIVEPNVCNFWPSVPKGENFLCATIKCLKYLSDRMGGGPNCEVLVSNKKWQCPDLLFEACGCNGQAKCIRLQRIIESRPWTILKPPSYLNDSGAAIFGEKHSQSTSQVHALNVPVLFELDADEDVESEAIIERELQNLTGHPLQHMAGSRQRRLRRCLRNENLRENINI